MAKNTDSSIKLLVLYDILLKSTDEEHALSTNEIIEELKKRGISVSRKVLPSVASFQAVSPMCSLVALARPTINSAAV